MSSSSWKEFCMQRLTLAYGTHLPVEFVSIIPRQNDLLLTLHEFHYPLLRLCGLIEFCSKHFNGIQRHTIRWWITQPNKSLTRRHAVSSRGHREKPGTRVDLCHLRRQKIPGECAWISYKTLWDYTDTGFSWIGMSRSLFGPLNCDIIIQGAFAMTFI